MVVTRRLNRSFVNTYHDVSCLVMFFAIHFKISIPKLCEIPRSLLCRLVVQLVSLLDACFPHSNDWLLKNKTRTSSDNHRPRVIVTPLVEFSENIVSFALHRNVCRIICSNGIDVVIRLFEAVKLLRADPPPERADFTSTIKLGR